MRRLLAIALLSISGFASPGLAADFAARVEERLTRYEPARTDPSGYRAALEGRLEESNRRLEEVVPDAEKTALDHFGLGNMLYRVDHERSFAHHRAALAMAPDEPLVWLEMAYQHHRRGECGRALRFYERVEEAGRLQDAQYALLAHCLVVAGRHVEALEAWARTDHPRNHTGVDFTIHDVFGDVSPLARHDQLMKRVLGGDRSAVGDLFENAIEWRHDWWNAKGPNEDALEAALAAVERTFGAEDSVTRELRVWLAARAAEGPEAFRALLEEEALIVGDGGLPQSSFVARQLVTRAARLEIERVDALAARFTAEVERRARGPELDPDALVLLGAFVAEAGTPAELIEVDRYGWKRYGNADFAYDLLQRRGADLGEAFTHDDPLLLEAVADFPGDARFSLLLLVRAIASEAATVEQVAQLIAAEYAGLTTDPSRYSYRLKRYFLELARRMPTAGPAASAWSR